MDIQWFTKDNLFPVVTKKIQATSIVLDIGCGINPQKFILPKIHICSEPYGEYINYLQKNYCNDRYIFLKSTWERVTELFPVKSVDTVFLIDVIEHLPKKEGRKLLALTEKIARRQIIIFTPLGFIPQFHSDGIDAWGLSGGDWQQHKSGWLPKDFDDTWDIYASKEFHTTNNKGVPYKEPHGAFWAIKTFPYEKKKESFTKKCSNILIHILGNSNVLITILRKIKHQMYLAKKKAK